MIHLDTNYLIGLLVRGSRAALDVDGWLATGGELAVSAVAWGEFLNGPVTPGEVARVDLVLRGRVLAFGRSEAELAARLFNRTGRRRGSRFDCLIAATAMLQAAELATINQDDFRPFMAHGLRLL